MNNMSTNSPVKHTVTLKAAQLGVTAAAENIIGYYIKLVPTEILYMSATDALLDKWLKRLEPLIDSIGARKLMYSMGAGNKRKTGDTAREKIFVGGSLNMASAQSASSLRSDSKRILVRDEIDGAPEKLKTGEGSFLDVSYARTFAFGDRAKIFDFSTPTLAASSVVTKLFEQGDQRKFLVACPHCGVFQELETGTMRGNHGVRGETEAGALKHIFYLCEHCHEAIFECDKQKLLNSGYWKPTAVPSDPRMRSYQIGGLYAPVGMLSWRDYFMQYQKSLGDMEARRAFVNTYEGLPFRENGERPKLESVIELRDVYRRGMIPSDEVLFITAGVDVQRGSGKRDESPRLEVQIMGHGAGWRKWVIDNFAIEGAIDDPFGGAWNDLYHRFVDRKFTFERKDGLLMSVRTMLIDSGDGDVTHTVYEFCARTQGVYPSKGVQKIKRSQKAEDGDVVDSNNIVRYRRKALTGRGSFILISTNYYKHATYNSLNNTTRHLDDKADRKGMVFFPYDLEDEYFAQLTSEERRTDGSFHKMRDRNEALDTFVMNLVAGDLYLDTETDRLKANARVAKWPQHEIDKVNYGYVLDFLKKQLDGKAAKR